MKKAVHIIVLIGVVLLFRVYSSAQSPGMLYGMTYNGGASGLGTLLGYNPVSGKDTVFINFSGANGDFPYGDVMQANNGRLYGMTSSGGQYGAGVLFYYNVITGKDSTAISFNGTDGSTPTGSLLQAADGKLYGTTQQGGTYTDGVLFRYDPVTGQDTVLVNFNDTNGKYPTGRLIQASNGMLYGLTKFGGSLNYGVIYRYDPVKEIDTVVVNLDNVNLGAYFGANASLIMDTNKLLYGITNQGGTGNNGVLFSYNTATKKDTVLIQFNTSTGYNPNGSLLQASNGVLYGMTYNYGTGPSPGSLFSYNTLTGKDTFLVDFNLTNGGYPLGSLMQASNGLLYGMTYQGGTNNDGVLFSYNIALMKDTVLVNLNNTTGTNPFGDLLEAMSYTVTGNDSLICNGDSAGWAKITTRGGSMPITFHWSNGSTNDSVSGLKGGSYICTVTDARGITFNATVNIYQPPPINPGATVSNVCFGDSNGVARVNVSGGTPPYTYKWNTGSTNDSIWQLSPGKDTCLITDAHGCSLTSFFTITQAPPFKIDSVVSTPASCPTCSNGSATVYVSGGVPPGDSVIYYYSWTYGGDSATVNGIPTGYDVVCVTSGYYKCGSACDSTLIVTGIAPLNNPIKDVNVYPVPGNGLETIEVLGNGYENLNIMDELGQVVYSTLLDKTRSNYMLHVDLRNQSNGVYFLQMIGNNSTVTRKLVIEK